MKSLKKNNGITLIALVITIIIMLILVAVTINIAINGGLFDYARRAANDTDIKKEAERDYTTLAENMSTDGIIDKYTTYGSTTYAAYTIGQTVTIAGQSFYVIEDSDEHTSTVKLLAALNVETELTSANYNKQKGNAGTVAFDSAVPYSNVYEDSTIKPLVDSYVSSLGVTVQEGRLMLRDELKSGHNDIFYNKSYWLGSTTGTCADFVNGESNPFSDIDVTEDSVFGLRPLIVILKDNIPSQD